MLIKNINKHGELFELLKSVSHKTQHKAWTNILYGENNKLLENFDCGQAANILELLEEEMKRMVQDNEDLQG